VKISTENGPVKSGDILTSSSIPGVAMKATKAGPIIGFAMNAYDGSETGTVLMFLKPGYYNGGNLVDLINETKPTTTLDRAILTQLLTQKDAISLDSINTNNLSEILTDRLAAAVEIITPQITAQNLTIETIEPFDKNLLVKLSDDSLFSIAASSSARPVATIDANGNAFFAGTITADKIQAGQIIGLEIITDKLTSLSDQLNNLATTSAILASVSSQSGIIANESPQSASQTEFENDSIFAKLVSFLGNVIFKGKVTFFESPEFAKDTAGFALIKKDQKKVSIKFEKEFANIPIININPVWDLEKDTASVADQLEGFFPYIPRYIITNLSKSGFTIILEDKVVSDLKFSWVALSVKEAITYESETDQTILENLITPTISPSVVTPTLILSPTPTFTPTPQLILSPSPVPGLTISPPTSSASDSASSN